ncbi:MAG: type II and III secretion system protein family protein [Kiritimatiellia bacterium]|nr:type II and III secretion system protein family protein [Kiritimatiellia bacterium]
MKESAEGASARIELTVGKSITLTANQPVKRAALSDPDIADMVVISPTQIYLRGKEPGLANMSVWDEQEKLTAIYEIEILYDISRLKALLYELFPEERNIRITPGYTVVHSQGGDKKSRIERTIILSGEVSSASRMSHALALLESYASGKVINLLQVSGVHQVMLDVRIAEISRSTMRKLGFEFSWVWGSEAPYAWGNLFKIAVSPALDADLLYHRGHTTWAPVINALKENGLAKMLAEPTLIALSGQEANFLVGGQIPIPVISAAAGGTVSGAEYKEYGIGLVFIPTVLNNKKISMKVTPEVSELDYKNAINIAGSLVPGMISRRASTVVELDDGQSFAIAGLLKDANRETIKKFPILGDIPVLGALFRSTEFQKDETELVIIVTPHLVTPLNMAEQSLPTDKYADPNDFEFFLLGALEGKSGNSKDEKVGPVPSGEKGGLDGDFGHIMTPTDDLKLGD